MAKLESILISERIAIGVGGTPLYRLANEKIPEGVNVLAKLESSNPTGSIKDRAAERIIKELLEGSSYVLVRNGKKFTEKKLEYRGQQILDSSSGNYGYSLAHQSKIKNLDLTLVVPGNIPKTLLEKILECGVELVVTDPLECKYSIQSLTGGLE